MPPFKPSTRQNNPQGIEIQKQELPNFRSSTDDRRRRKFPASREYYDYSVIESEGGVDILGVAEMFLEGESIDEFVYGKLTSGERISILRIIFHELFNNSLSEDRGYAFLIGLRCFQTSDFEVIKREMSGNEYFEKWVNNLAKQVSEVPLYRLLRDEKVFGLMSNVLLLTSGSFNWKVVIEPKSAE